MALIVMILLVAIAKAADEHLKCDQLKSVVIESEKDSSGKFIMETIGLDKVPSEKLEFKYTEYFLQPIISQSKIDDSVHEIYTKQYDGFFCELKKSDDPNKYIGDKKKRCNAYLQSTPLFRAIERKNQAAESQSQANESSKEASAQQNEVDRSRYSTRCFFFKESSGKPDYIVVLNRIPKRSLYQVIAQQNSMIIAMKMINEVLQYMSFTWDSILPVTEKGDKPPELFKTGEQPKEFFWVNNIAYEYKGEKLRIWYRFIDLENPLMTKEIDEQGKNVIVYEAINFLKKFVSQNHGCRKLMLKFGSENPELRFFDYFAQYPSFKQMVPIVKGLARQFKSSGSNLYLPYDISGYLKPIQMAVMTYCVFGAPLSIETLRDLQEIAWFKEQYNPLFDDHPPRFQIYKALSDKMNYDPGALKRNFEDFFINEESVNPFQDIQSVEEDLGIPDVIKQRHVTMDPIDCIEEQIRLKIAENQRQREESEAKQEAEEQQIKKEKRDEKRKKREEKERLKMLKEEEEEMKNQKHEKDEDDNEVHDENDNEDHEEDDNEQEDHSEENSHRNSNESEDDSSTGSDEENNGQENEGRNTASEKKNHNSEDDHSENRSRNDEEQSHDDKRINGKDSKNTKSRQMRIVEKQRRRRDGQSVTGNRFAKRRI